MPGSVASDSSAGASSVGSMHEEAAHGQHELEDDQDVLGAHVGIEAAVYGIVYTLSKEKMEHSRKFAAFRVVVDFLQLFILLANPAFGWHVHEQSWAWKYLSCVQFETPVIHKAVPKDSSGRRTVIRVNIMHEPLRLFHGVHCTVMAARGVVLEAEHTAAAAVTGATQDGDGGQGGGVRGMPALDEVDEGPAADDANGLPNPATLDIGAFSGLISQLQAGGGSDDAASQASGSQGASSFAGGGDDEHGADYQRGKQYKKLYKILCGKHMQQAISRFYRWIIGLVGVQLAIHLICFSLFAKHTLDLKSYVLDVDAAGQASDMLHRMAMNALILRELHQGLNAPGIYTTHDIPHFTKLFRGRIDAFEGVHQGIFLGFHGIRELKNIKHTNLKDLWQEPNKPATFLADLKQPKIQNATMSFWELGNHYIMAAREVMSNHDRMAGSATVFGTNTTDLESNRFWQFVINNGPGSLFEGYKLVLDGLVTRAMDQVDKVNTIAIVLLMLEMSSYRRRSPDYYRRRGSPGRTYRDYRDDRRSPARRQSEERAINDRQSYPGPPASEDPDQRPLNDAQFRKVCSVARAIVVQEVARDASSRPGNDYANGNVNRRGNSSAAPDVLHLAQSLVDTKLSEASLRKELVLQQEKIDALTAKLDKFKRKKKRPAPDSPPAAITISDGEPTSSEAVEAGSPWRDAAAAATAAKTQRTPTKTPRVVRKENPTPSTSSEAAPPVHQWKARDLPANLRGLLKGVDKATKTSIKQILTSTYPGSTTLEPIWKAVFGSTKPYPRTRPEVLTVLTAELFDNFDKFLA